MPTWAGADGEKQTGRVPREWGRRLGIPDTSLLTSATCCGVPPNHCRGAAPGSQGSGLSDKSLQSGAGPQGWTTGSRPAEAPVHPAPPRVPAAGPWLPNPSVICSRTCSFLQRSPRQTAPRPGLGPTRLGRHLFATGKLQKRSPESSFLRTRCVRSKRTTLEDTFPEGRRAIFPAAGTWGPRPAGPPPRPAVLSGRGLSYSK